MPDYATRRSTALRANSLGSWLDRTHGSLHVCPGCDLAVYTVGLTHLVYEFKTCACGTPEQEHLVEQLWHRDCFIDQEDAAVEDPTEDAHIGGVDA